MHYLIQGYGSLDTVTDTENVKVDLGEEPEDDYEYNSYQRAVLSIQEAVSNFYKKHRTVIWTVIAIILFIAYFVYFGLALNYRYVITTLNCGTSSMSFLILLRPLPFLTIRG